MKDILRAMDEYTKFTAVDILSGKRVRCMKEGGENVFVFGYRKKRYGRRYLSFDSFLLKYTDLKLDEDTDESWKKRLKKASRKLETSGLWPEYLEVINNLQRMTLEELKAFRNDYWAIPYGKSLYPALSLWKEKYPFLISKTESGTEYVNSVYLYTVSECRMKSMYFGRLLNKREKETIKQYLAEKRDYSSGRIQVGYDVSFEYKADANKAWYSEEYRGCGNGHYYIALDHTTALFIEND